MLRTLLGFSCMVNLKNSGLHEITLVFCPLLVRIPLYEWLQPVLLILSGQVLLALHDTTGNLHSRQVFHPNINSNGNICLDNPKEQCTHAPTISKVFILVCSHLYKGTSKVIASFKEIWSLRSIYHFILYSDSFLIQVESQCKSSDSILFYIQIAFMLEVL